MRSKHLALTKVGALTVTFNHEWFDDIVSNYLKVGVADPVADSGLGTSEEVVDDSDLVTQEHEAVDEVGSDKTSATGNQDTLALRWGQEFDGRETREGGVGNSVAVWMEDGLGLVGCKTLGEPGVQLCLLCILLREIGAARGGQDVMRAKIERPEEVNGDFTVEAKPIETNGLDFSTRLVQDFDLVRPEHVRNVHVVGCQIRKHLGSARGKPLSVHRWRKRAL